MPCAAAAFALASLAPASAHSQCVYPTFVEIEPVFLSRVPEPPNWFSKPSVPFCLSSYAASGTHSCDELALSAYFDGVASYTQQLAIYIDDAKQFSFEARDYAMEAFEFANAALLFAEEVEAFAGCEVTDVQTQHQ